jgi:pimeloyl-ACP methyl ester carboxylesterase
VTTRTRKKKPRQPRGHADDLRGASRLVIDATKRVTDVVQGMHVTIASGPAILGSPLQVPARAITGLVYGSIRGVTHMVGATIDAVLAKLAPLLGKSAPGTERAAVVAALNGVIGDYLRETGNPLATEMTLCRGGEPLEIEREALRAALPEGGRKLLVLVHGICMNDVQWNLGGHDHGAALARDLGYTPVYLRYNSGLHISTNGRGFAELLERLVAAWYAPIDELVLLGHSMGGLVSRSACHVGEAAGHAWRAKLSRLVCIASPHDGAPLERAGNWVEPLLGVSRYSAPLSRLGRLRSAGVTDLRHGNVLDDDWDGRDRFAIGGDPRTGSGLPSGVRCYAIAGSLSRGPRKKPLGDGMVPVDSALGRSPKSVDRALAFPEEHQWVAYGVGHLQVLSRPAVYERLRSWLAE